MLFRGLSQALCLARKENQVLQIPPAHVALRAAVSNLPEDVWMAGLQIASLAPSLSMALGRPSSEGFA